MVVSAGKKPRWGHLISHRPLLKVCTDGLSFKSCRSNFVVAAVEVSADALEEVAVLVVRLLRVRGGVDEDARVADHR